MIYSATVALPDDIPQYSIHQYLYGYFPQHPRDGLRPFLFRIAGNRCLLVSRIRPACPHTEITLEAGRAYPVEALLVPVRKPRDENGKTREVPMLSNAERRTWFTAVCARFGGQVGFCQWFNRPRVQFQHDAGHLITLQPAQVKAMIFLTDPVAFTEMLLLGLGRGKAFGYGLLTIAEVMI